MTAGLLQMLAAQTRVEDMRRAAREHRAAEPPAALPAATPVTLRFSFPDDDQAVARLAVLDSAKLPTGPLLLAEASGELRAALSLADGSVIADPFHQTAHLVKLLRIRASQLDRPNRRRRIRIPRLRPALEG